MADNINTTFEEFSQLQHEYSDMLKKIKKTYESNKIDDSHDEIFYEGLSTAKSFGNLLNVILNKN